MSEVQARVARVSTCLVPPLRHGGIVPGPLTGVCGVH